jgi:SET domain-containing protein
LGETIHQPIQYQEISSRLQAKPIKNLAAAIGINERFLYTRELFANDAKKFEQAIEIMNNAASFNDAYNYMIREYTWDMDSEMVQDLLELVKRKFITGQHE